MKMTHQRRQKRERRKATKRTSFRKKPLTETTMKSRLGMKKKSPTRMKSPRTAANTLNCSVGWSRDNQKRALADLHTYGLFLMLRRVERALNSSHLPVCAHCYISGELIFIQLAVEAQSVRFVGGEWILREDNQLQVLSQHFFSEKKRDTDELNYCC